VKIYIFGTVPLPIIRSLFTVHSALVYVDSFRTGPGWSCSKAVIKSAWPIPVPSVQWINSWWWAEELPETCKVSCRSKFGKLVHLACFIIKKFVALHRHMNVKNGQSYLKVGNYIAVWSYKGYSLLTVGSCRRHSDCSLGSFLLLPDLPCHKYVLQSTAARQSNKENLMNEQKQTMYFYRHIVALF
jgi:hypothetical protein